MFNIFQEATKAIEVIGDAIAKNTTTEGQKQQLNNDLIKLQTRAMEIEITALEKAGDRDNQAKALQIQQQKMLLEKAGLGGKIIVFINYSLKYTTLVFIIYTLYQYIPYNPKF